MNVNNVQTNNSDNEIIWSEDITVPIEPEENNLSLSEKLQQWYIKYSPSRKSFDALLTILKEENLNVPASCNSLIIIIPKKAVVRTVTQGTYIYPCWIKKPTQEN